VSGGERAWSGESSRGARDSSGHTVLEVALVLALFSVVLVSVHLALISQHRFYALNAQLANTRDAARIAAEVLTGELRGASPAAGDLYAVSADSVALRSTRGIGVICGASGNTIDVWRLTGTLGDSGSDSVLIFLENSPDSSFDDAWTAAAVQRVRSGGAGSCPNGRPPEVRLDLDRPVTGFVVGSPVRAFRPYVYRLYLAGDGRWWLGQRLRYGRIQPVVGPFAAPGEGGLILDFLGSGGVPTADPAQVVEVLISIRSQSASPLPWVGGAGFLTDSLQTAVYLRNS